MSLFAKLLPSFLRPYRPGDEVRIDPPPLDHAQRWLSFLTWPQFVHRYEVEGLEHVPRTGPALVVSPHSFAALDMFLLGKRIFERDGRLLRGLTDHLVFKIPLMRDVFSTLGIVDGTQDNGLALLESGQLAVCMPGGGYEWSRSSRLRRTLRWGDHRGYARLAAQAGVPIIPTACPAADDLYLVVLDGWTVGEIVKRVFRTRRVYPVPLWTGLGPFPFPVKLRQYVGEPQWPKTEGDLEERARDLDERVRRVLVEMLGRG